MTPAGQHLRRPGRVPGTVLPAVLLCAVAVLVALPATAAPVPASARGDFSRIFTGDDGRSAPPPPPAGRCADPAGAATVGTTEYPVPADAVYVSPSGSNSGPGTVDAPLRTVAQAVDAAAERRHRGAPRGTYNENVTIPKGKRLTLQSYPREAVWFDGSREVTGWAADGSAWRVSGWTRAVRPQPDLHQGRRGRLGELGVREPGLPDGRPPRHGLHRRRAPAAGRLAVRRHRRHVLRRRRR